MARFITKCSHCANTIEILEYQDAVQEKWVMLGWKVEDNKPIMMCSECYKKWLTTPKVPGKLPSTEITKEEVPVVEVKKKRGRPKKIK
jgi:hypothetical protein